MEPRKNHAGLLAAYLNLALHEQGVHLVLVGKKAADVPAFDQQMTALPANIRSFIHHFDYLSDEDLKNIYRAADYFVYPSLAEGFGIPPLEAAAMCLPVLCSNQTAMSDFERLGIQMFNPLKQGDLEQKLSALLTNPPTEQHLETIKNRIHDLYSWHSSAASLHELIQQNHGANAI